MFENTDSGAWYWFSGHWFLPQTWREFHWENPFYLYLLMALPLLFLIRWLLHLRTRQKIEVAMLGYPRYPINLLRFLPDIFFALFLAGVIVALARPQRADLQVEQHSEGIDILLLMDISESMRIRDFEPDRLEASKRVAINFVQGRPFDRIGIVVFSGEAYSLSPLTTDHRMLEAYTEQIDYDLIPESGTAIGSALGVAANRLRESKVKSKVIILISDGDNTAGSLDPITAAQLAAYYGIKIYTIVVGREGKVPVPNRNGNGVKYEENTIDVSSLREIAEIGEGQFFRASNTQTLEEVFRQIDRYEKTKITETRFETIQDYYRVYLYWALLFFLVWLFLKGTFVSNVLED